MAEQFSIPTVGDLIAGKYRVDEELGRGAYGVVFRADQEELGRSVAVKTLLPQAFLQQDIVQRFHREAQLISRLDHPNIIRLYDYGVDEGLLYMAVEYVEGRTLMELIENDAPLEPSRVRDLSLQILDALEHAHAQGIVHRDLKPENIVLLETRTSDGREYEVVKILDFGISKLLLGDEEQGALKSLTQDGTVLGTPHYMSPENIVGDPIDHRADIYAFGLILYEMLLGEHPFDAPSPSAVMVRHLRDDPPQLPDDLDASPFGEAIRRCLEKQPWDRISTIRELLDILEVEDIGEVDVPYKRPSMELRSPARPSSDPDATDIDAPPPQKSNRALPILLLVTLLAILAGSVGYKVWLAAEATGGAGASETQTVTPPTDPKRVADRDQERSTPGVSEPSVDAGDRGGGADVGIGAAMVFAPRSDAGSAPETTEVSKREDEERKTAQVEQKRRRPEQKRRTRPDDSEAKDSKRGPPALERSRKAEEVEEAEEARIVEVDISSVPTNANVTIDGVPVGSTPLRRSVAAESPLEIRFSHIGYKEKILRVVPSEEERTVRATLEKEQLQFVD